MNLNTTALHPRFGVEVHEVGLSEVTVVFIYPEIRSAFEQHSLLLFRNQSLNDEYHLKLAGLFGSVENREEGAWGVTPPEAGKVSNLTDDKKLASQTARHL